MSECKKKIICINILNFVGQYFVRLAEHFMVVDVPAHHPAYLNFVEILCTAIDPHLDSTTFRKFPYSRRIEKNDNNCFLLYFDCATIGVDNLIPNALVALQQMIVQVLVDNLDMHAMVDTIAIESLQPIHLD